MTQFEDELKRALARREPSEDFVRQVLAKTKADGAGTVKARFFAWHNTWWHFASAAVLLMALISGLAYRQRERAAQGEAAKAQLVLAMRIAGSQLHQAQLRVKQIGSVEVVQ